MSRPRSLLDYCGPSSRLDISAILKLSPKRWGVMPKADGWYVHVYLDGRGKIERVLTRTGQPVPKAKLGDLVGCEVGAPDSVLAGELLDHNCGESYPVVQLFDAIRVNGPYLARERFRVRRDWLFRSQSWAECMGERRHYGVEKPTQRIEQVRARHKRSGRFCPAVPRTWERTPILPLMAPGLAGELWEQARAGDVEGLVAVALDAPLGRRGSKKKAKPVSDLDCVVLSVDPTGIVARVRGSETIVALGHRRGVDVVVGDIIEVEHEGWYASGPRFARLARVRRDLFTTVNTERRAA